MEEGQTFEAGAAARRPEPRFVGVTDADQVFVAVSDDLAALLGYAPGELVGVPSERVMLGLDGVELERARRRAVYDGGLSGEVILLHRTGLPLRYRYSMRAVRSGAGTLYVTVGEPVTDGPIHDGGLVAPILLTKKEAATVARRSVRSIDRAIAAGELHATGRPGERRLIELADLRRWLKMSGLFVLGALALLGLLFLACVAGVDTAHDVMRRLGCPLA